jgi:hypothetical protein
MAGDGTTVRWITAFLDTPAGSAPPTELFWCGLTHTRLSPRRGESGAFATLLPHDGDAFLRVQRTHSGEAGLHLDLHVADIAAAEQAAVRLGAHPVAQFDDCRVLRSPGGFVFCFVPVGEHAHRPTPTGPSGLTSLCDQVCLDIAPELFDAEAAFWVGVAGWPCAPAARPEFTVLPRPPGLPIRLLLQRLDAGRAVRGHLDFACENVEAEVERHLSLGALRIARERLWTVLADPVGRRYCVTARNPYTGVLPAPG